MLEKMGSEMVKKEEKESQLKLEKRSGKAWPDRNSRERKTSHSVSGERDT